MHTALDTPRVPPAFPTPPYEDFYSLLRSEHATSMPVRWLRKSEGRLCETDGLLLYRSMYRIRLLQTLESDFPELLDYLGEAQFASLAQAFIACTPSQSHTLADYGPRFPDFLRDQARGSERASKSHLLAMAELAELELEEEALWDQSPPATCASENWQHAMTDWSTLRFSLNSKVRILEFKHLPLSRVLPSRSVAGECASPSDSETDEPDGWCLLLARTSTGVQRRALSECARTLLLALGRGSDLVGAIALVPDLPEHPELIFSWFKQWISEGILEVH